MKEKSVSSSVFCSSSIRSSDDRNRLFVGGAGACKSMHGKGMVYQMKRQGVMCIIQCHWPRTATVLISAKNQLVKHSNEKSSTRRADSSRRGSAVAAFGVPRKKFGDAVVHLGSAAAWLGGVFVWVGDFLRQ